MFSSFLECVTRFETNSWSIIQTIFLLWVPAMVIFVIFCLTLRYLMGHFGVPLSKSKAEGPCTHLSFLGIKMNSVEMVFRLPEDKLRKLMDLVEGFC